MIEYKEKLPEILLKYKTGDCQRVKIKDSNDAAFLLRKLYDHDTIEYQESAILLLLNRASNTIGWVKLSSGGMNSTIIDVKMIYTIALKAGASGIMISHNHPSGQTRPSESDKKLTVQIKEAGKILDILFLDHIIITKDSHYSFADELLL